MSLVPHSPEHVIFIDGVLHQPWCWCWTHIHFVHDEVTGEPGVITVHSEPVLVAYSPTPPC